WGIQVDYGGLGRRKLVLIQAVKLSVARHLQAVRRLGPHQDEQVAVGDVLEFGQAELLHGQRRPAGRKLTVSANYHARRLPGVERLLQANAYLLVARVGSRNAPVVEQG